MRYEIIEAGTGAVLRRFEDRASALRAWPSVHSARPPDAAELDLVEVDGDVRRSLLIRPQESGVRVMVAEAAGKEYASFRSLEEARRAPVAAVILEADYGGQITATAPVTMVRCSDERLRRLARELAGITGSAGEGSADVYFEPLRPGDGVPGGMGGGVVTDALWVHEEIRQLRLTEGVEAVLLGAADELPGPDPDMPPDVKAGVLRAYRDRVDALRWVFGLPQPPYMRSQHIRWTERQQNLYLPPPERYSRWYPSAIRAVARAAGLPIPPPAGVGDVDRVVVFEKAPEHLQELFALEWTRKHRPSARTEDGATARQNLLKRRVWRCRRCKTTAWLEDVYVDRSLGYVAPRCRTCGAVGWSRMRTGDWTSRRFVVFAAWAPDGERVRLEDDDPVAQALGATDLDGGVVVPAPAGRFPQHVGLRGAFGVKATSLEECVVAGVSKLQPAASWNSDRVLITHVNQPVLRSDVLEDLFSVVMHSEHVSVAAIAIDGQPRLPCVAWRPVLTPERPAARGRPRFHDDGTVALSDGSHALPVVRPVPHGSYELQHDHEPAPTADSWYGMGPLRTLADELQRANAAVTSAVEARDARTEAFRALLEERRDAQLRVYNPRFAIDTGRLRRRKSQGIHGALVFLEVDPYCFRSGYRKSRLLGYLSRTALDEHASDRARALVAAWVRRPWWGEADGYVKLARSVLTEEFRHQLRVAAHESKIAAEKVARIGVRV